MNCNEKYLASIKQQFHYYKSLGEKAMDQLEAEQLFISNKDTNSIAIIVQHLYGNMLSRWTDFLTTDGEKEWRNRDNEFEKNISTKKELLKIWEEGWNCLFNAINSLSPAQLMDIIYIRGEELTVVEAINRQLAHYAYHAGQIVFAARQLKQTEWTSLSIPRNRSKEYNLEKFPKKISSKCK